MVPRVSVAFDNISSGSAVLVMFNRRSNKTARTHGVVCKSTFVLVDILAVGFDTFETSLPSTKRRAANAHSRRQPAPDAVPPPT